MNMNEDVNVNMRHMNMYECEYARLESRPHRAGVVPLLPLGSHEKKKECKKASKQNTTHSSNV
jgi:hypothetical protein